MSEPSPSPSETDHGRVVKKTKQGVAWVWIFPILAAFAAAWLFWTQWTSRGPLIEIVFESAPGIVAGKTQLVYRGLNSGTVESVRLDDKLNHVIVSVRLESFAAGLAVSGSDFWVERPVISLTELTGIESIIQGNSIHARTNGGKPQTRFAGLSEAPLMPTKPGVLTVQLEGDNIPFLGRGAPVFYRGVQVGLVRNKQLNGGGKPQLSVAIDEKFRWAVRENSRFWVLPATAVSLGQNGFKLDIAGINALVEGGIAFDHFGTEAEAAGNDSRFILSSTEALARASGRAFKVTFEDGRGLLAGQTQVCLAGVPVGIVESVDPLTAGPLVQATIRLQPEYEALASSNAEFTLVKPRISLSGVSGLETLFSGVYIAVEPGSGGPAPESFTGRSISDDEWKALQAEKQGLQLVLKSDQIPSIAKGAPVFYRGVVVGTVLGKYLDSEQNPAMRIVIKPEFRGAVSANSRFWRVPATAVRAGPGVLEIDIEGVEALLKGGVAFDVFGPRGDVANAESEFVLFDDEQTARAESEPIHIRFDNGRGLVAGQSQLRYLGVPVGMVEDVRPVDGQVHVTARLDNGYEFLRREGSIFSVVRPNISLQGVSGLETLVSGVYIECTPGVSRKSADNFVGISSAGSEDLPPGGLSLRLTAPSTPINSGAAVLYRGIGVGRVTSKKLAANGSEVVLEVSIAESYAHLVRSNSVFWDASGLKASVGFLKFRIQTETVMSPDGRISFSTPERTPLAMAAKNGDTFQLHSSPKSDWITWNPTIPKE
ncbi:MAG: MCE family protein [Verrucomicrobia bacterium]|nr:MCE family protein [Verrucomicrobiota bacterium]